MSNNPYEIGLGKNEANFVALSPPVTSNAVPMYTLTVPV